MKFNHESVALRELASAIERANIVTEYLTDYGKQLQGGVTLAWTCASSCAGYQEAREAIEDEVEKLIPQAIESALLTVQASVAAKRARLEQVTTTTVKVGP